jgi:basic membrane lipoprotein Med (substrate-binding protein (PBP1-ABC) superfamily)
MAARNNRKHCVLTAGFAICLIFASTTMASCSKPSPSYKVAVIGFKDGYLAEERTGLAEFGATKVEAELGAQVDFIKPGSPEATKVFSSDLEGYDLVVALGQQSSLDMLFSKPQESDVPTVALDFETSQPVPGENQASLVRYRVEEGSYICGFLAGWLTGRNDHPLTNSLPLCAFIGSLDDPLEPYYDGGFSKGVKAASPSGGTHRYFINKGDDAAQARAYAEEAVKKGVDIIFCTPGPFNDAVIKVAEQKNILLILVGPDRSKQSPEHILTSLVLRDDNALLDAVQLAREDRLQPGRSVLGIEDGVWSLAPFGDQDVYIRKELKEALSSQEEKVSSIDFSS